MKLKGHITQFKVKDLELFLTVFAGLLAQLFFTFIFCSELFLIAAGMCILGASQGSMHVLAL